MDETLYNALTGYYDTLNKTGYLPTKDAERVYIMCFISELIEDPSFSFFATECDNCILSKLYECIITNNCLIN